MKMNRPYRSAASLNYIILCVCLIIGYFFLRIVNITKIPLFIDEAISIEIAERIQESSPFVDAWQGRLFSIWTLLPYQPFHSASAFIVRIITVFAQLVALTALLRVIRKETGTIAAFISWFFLLFSPYHHFFHRMSLPDSFAAAFQTLAIALTWHWLKRPSYYKAMIIGSTLFFAFGAKINSVIFFPAPFAAWLSLNHIQRMRRGSILWMLLSILTATFLAIVLVLALSLIGQDFLTTFRVHRGASSSLNIAQTILNAENSFNVLRSYLSTPLLLFSLVSLVYLIAKRRIYLPLVTLAPMLAIWSVQTQQSRFWITPTTLLLIACAITIAELIQLRRRLVSLVTLLLLTVWSLTVALPFLSNSLWYPAQLTLPKTDKYQYLQGEGAGLAMSDVNSALNLHQPQLVLGIINNCLSLRYLSLSDFPVHCPRVNYTGEDIPKHIALMEENRSRGVYAVLDSTPFTPSEAPGMLITVIPSPDETILYSIYDLSPKN